MKPLVTLAFLLVSFSVFASEFSLCTLTYQKDQNSVYPFESIFEFIKIEIRPELSRQITYFNVHVHSECPDGSKNTVSLNMSSNTLYIIGINGTKLPDEVVKYTNDPLVINKEQFAVNVHNAFTFDQLTLKEKQSLLKMLAFVFAETARFSDVNTAVNKVFTDNCQVKWKNYSRLLRRWKTLSIFANSQGVVGSQPYTGGTRAFLLAPITPEIIERYNTAVTKGWKVVRGKYGDARRSDKPIVVPNVTCQ